MGCIYGRIQHSYKAEPCHYRDIDDMLLKMDSFFDQIQFPMASTESRHFTKVSRRTGRKESVRLMQNPKIIQNRGEQATFIIQVQYRQNSTWQGKIVWAEENKTQHFRSALELLKLIDSAIASQASRNVENDEIEISFKDVPENNSGISLSGSTISEDKTIKKIC